MYRVGVIERFVKFKIDTKMAIVIVLGSYNILAQIFDDKTKFKTTHFINKLVSG